MVGIEGLSGVMSAIIDYRGERIVAQTIIPGVLSGVSVFTYYNDS